MADKGETNSIMKINADGIKKALSCVNWLDMVKCTHTMVENMGIVILMGVMRCFYFW